MKNSIHITIVLLFSSVMLFAQTNETKRADAYFAKFAYVDAAKLYEKIAIKTPTQHVLQRLGDSYYHNVNMKAASIAYRKLFLKYENTITDKDYFFKYAQSLRGISDYAASDIWMKKFHEAKKVDDRGIHFVSNATKKASLEKDPNYTIKNLESINTKHSDFGATVYNDVVLFSSKQRENRFVKRTHSWDKGYFLDIYKVAEKNIFDTTAKTHSFSEDINSKYHESSITFSPDKKVLYFTRNNYNKGKYREDKEGTNKLKIYSATVNSKGRWKNITELPFNSNEYSVGHPTVSADGRRLYFTSDMPGGYGQTDIWYVTILDNNTFGKPQNLGANINTKGREMFPFVAADDVLYFSSDGYFGLGALDVFSSKQDIQGDYQAPKNLKAPINSPLDDFSFSINLETKKGYLSSNRAGGKGDDDIYSITKLKERVIPPCFTQKQGVVVDVDTQELLPGSKVVLITKKGVRLDSTIVGADAKFSFKLSCDSTYTVHASKQYFKPAMKQFVAKKSTEKETVKLALQLSDDFVHCGVGRICVKIKPIYFDYNKSNIRPDAAEELQKIVAVMNKYPQINIQSGSHTDARGRASYNEKLSDRRAKSTVRYIISKGISSNRITGKGFGETQLTNNCVDNDRHTDRVKCSKEEHQANRRTEFVIVKMK